jgi:LysR family transcriptional activator of nhaA
MKSTWINYHHLLYFKTIAEEGTVSKAAEKLRLGQPTLSVQLKQLEESLGVTLFERHHKRLVLTEHGKVALYYSKNIFNTGLEMIEVLNDRFKPLKPSLSIGSLDSIPKQIILKLIQAAYKGSNCQISLSEGKSEEIIRDLFSHQIDIVVTNFIPTGPKFDGLFHKTITNKTVSFYGAPRFKSLRKNFPKSISNTPVILPTYDSKLRHDIDHWARRNAIELNIIAESQDIGTKKLMATHSLGIIPTAPHTVSRQVSSRELIKIGKLQGVHEQLFLLMANRKLVNPIAEKLFSSFRV